MITSGLGGPGEIVCGQKDHQLVENSVGPGVLIWIF